MVETSRMVSPPARWPVLGAALLALTCGACAVAHAHSQREQEEANKALVLKFATAMQEQDIGKAAAFLAVDYVQHNPFIPPGKAGFVKFFSNLWKASPPRPVQAVEPPALLVAEKDLVVVAFRRPRPEPADPTKTYDSFWFDAYRIVNGKLVEHWDPLTKPQAGTVPQP